MPIEMSEEEHPPRTNAEAIRTDTQEREYLKEQLRKREKALSVINNCSTIFTSSLNIQEVFGSFIKELRRIINVSWASIELIGKEGLSCIALSSTKNSPYQIGEKIPMESSGTEWVITHKKLLVENDLSKECKFTSG